MRFVFLFVFVFLHAQCKRYLTKVPEYQEYYYDQKLDHFNFQLSKTYANRYLLCTKYFNESNPKSPIFFYAGNEGDIVGFYNNSGYIFELAQEYGALVIFIEHRYYGKSKPDEKFTYQSVENTLADFIEILMYVKQEKYKFDKQSALIVFGGSYGGMLAAWIRMKYPHIIDGALAASAPVLDFEGEIDPYEYSRVLTNAFAVSRKGCDDIIRKGFLVTDDLKNQKKYDLIQQYYGTCQKLTTDEDITKVFTLITNALNGISYANYPTENSFLRPLPAWSVKYSCDKMNEVPTDDPYYVLKQMKELLSIYYNYTGWAECIDIDWPFAPFLGDDAWNYQACSQLVLPVGSNGKTDFLLPEEWDLKSYEDMCQEMFPGIRVDPYWIPMHYHTDNIKYYSNIIFSNGDLDPWSAGGVFKKNIESDTVYAIVIEDGGHHVDLRFSSELDTPTIKAAREQEKSIIEGWIKDKLKY